MVEHKTHEVQDAQGCGTQGYTLEYQNVSSSQSVTLGLNMPVLIKYTLQLAERTEGF